MQKIIEAQQATDILTPSPIFLPLPCSHPALHSRLAQPISFHFRLPQQIPLPTVLLLGISMA